MEKEKKRVSWSDPEIKFLLTIMRDKNIVDMLNEKGHRNAGIFKIVERELRKEGFVKSLLQIRTKWKALKVQYYKIKRANPVSASDTKDCPFWSELDGLLGHSPGRNGKGVDKHGTTGTKELEEADTSRIFGTKEEEVDSSHVLLGLDEAIEIKEGEIDNAGVLLGLAETEYSDGDVDTPEMVSDSEPTAGSSKEHEPDRELGPVRKKRKVVKKGGYSEALKSFSKDLKDSQKETANMFLEKQAEMMAKEMEEQKKWERQLMEEDRTATERMMTNLMSSFFQNLRQVYQQPLQAPTANSVPVQFPTPDTPPP